MLSTMRPLRLSGETYFSSALVGNFDVSQRVNAHGSGVGSTASHLGGGRLHGSLQVSYIAFGHIGLRRGIVRIICLNHQFFPFRL